MEVIVLLVLAGFGIGIYNSYTSKNKNNSESYSNSLSSTTPPPRLNEKRIDLSDITLAPEQKKLFEEMENTNTNLFITGKAGTGKSTLLQYFKQNTTKKVVVVAPTGVAALNVGGQTIHSLFRIKPGLIRKEDINPSYKTATLLKNLDTVVIDEISMVRADIMEGIDQSLRLARESNLPFGGAQIIMFGDLFQLPPVIDDPELEKYFSHNYGGVYFFNAPGWKQSPFITYELMQIHRQKDEVFIAILNAIRKGEINEETLLKLNSRTTKDIPPIETLTLAPTNAVVSQINDDKLAKLDEKIYEYKAILTGDLEKSAMPTEEILRLKKGAQIMLIKNDKQKRWVNGTLGKIYSLSENEIKIIIDNKYIYSVAQETWNKIRYEYDSESRKIREEVVSSFTQYPLKLAWAITIHKSQGQTYGSVTIEMGDGAFAHGQTYVALSRCATFEGLFLKRNLRNEDVIVDPEILTFMKSAKILDIEIN